MSNALKSFVVCSVLLNLLLAGIVLGNAGRYFVKSSKGYTWQEIEEALPVDTHPKFEKTIEQAERDTSEMRHQLSDIRKKELKILRADPFDKKAWGEQMQQIKQLRAQIMERMIEAVGQFSEQLSLEDRATLADMMRYPPRPSHEE